MGSAQKEGVDCGTHVGDTRRRRQLLSWGKGMKRKHQGWSWGGRGKGETLWLHPLPPGSTCCPWCPSFTLGPQDSLSCSASGPQRLLLLLPFLDFFPLRVSRKMTLRVQPQHPVLLKVQLMLSCFCLFSNLPVPLSRTESFIPSFLSSLLLGEKTQNQSQKESTSPQGGPADSGGRGLKERRTAEGRGSQVPGREGQGVAERRGVRAVAAPFLCHPCPLSRGLQHN
jgi:hypothetical protein